MNNKETRNEYIRPIVFKENRNINSDSYLRYGVNSRASKVLVMKILLNTIFNILIQKFKILDLQ